MQNEKNTNIPAAKEKLEDTLTYFMDVAQAFDASDGLLTLLSDIPDDTITKQQTKALYGVLQVLNAMSALQIAEISSGNILMHTLKIA